MEIDRMNAHVMAVDLVKRVQVFLPVLVEKRENGLFEAWFEMVDSRFQEEAHDSCNLDYGAESLVLEAPVGRLTDALDALESAAQGIAEEWVATLEQHEDAIAKANERLENWQQRH